MMSTTRNTEKNIMTDESLPTELTQDAPPRRRHMRCAQRHQQLRDDSRRRHRRAHSGVGL